MSKTGGDWQNGDPSIEQWTDWELPEPASGPTPQRTIDWVERALGAPVISERSLVGGVSSAVSLLTMGPPFSSGVVLRRHTNADWMIREPCIPFDEARILGLLDNSTSASPLPPFWPPIRMLDTAMCRHWS